MLELLVRSRRCLPLIFVVSLGCKGGDDEETTADTASTPATGTATDSGTGGTGSESGAPTSTPTTSLTEVMTSTEDPSAGTGSASGSTGASSGVTTGSEPVPCDTPEGCTDMGEGDLDAFSLPFFRGTVCVSDAVQPGDALALAVTTCTHPCLAVSAFSFKWVYRCDGGDGCEVALAYFHPKTTGADCPSDVFGEFDPGLCEQYGPKTITIKPPKTDGAASLLLPFLTNADIAAIEGGQDDNAAVWGLVDAHTQAPGRRLALDFAADNDAAPATCGEGLPGCTCTKIGLP